MADFDLSVLVNRDLLGLTPLECNDGIMFKGGEVLLGAAAVAWTRNQITSPYTDGAFTVDRSRQVVNEQPQFEVYGRTAADFSLSSTQLKKNLNTLVAAFSQDSFTFTVTIDGAVYSYQAEAADYQLTYTGPRLAACQVMVTFTMPRQPVPLVGAV